ncbi:MAG: response regulator transcription factor [Candidatus Fimisoma sp.]|jgi:two-component system copper resistance phosphate regulon response regulator CusR|nr:response regulator transcription factor [Candidatus Fimisoma sp.]
MRILIAEDQKDLNRIITKRLSAEGYYVDSCFDGEEALSYIEMAEYDGIILDIMMPKRDGLSVLHSLREKGIGTPVLFLTARDTVEDRVLGLDSGADDYLVKPFAFDELIARIRAMTRKSAGNSSNIFSVADLVMDTASHTVTRGGREIALSAKEFSLLEYLLRNKGHVLSRTMIENNLWNFDYSGGTNAVDVYIRYLRKKVDDGFEPKLIHTVRGCGYVLKENQVLP